MTAIGMLVAGVTSYLVQRGRVDARVDADLAQEVEELRTFTGSGVDPETGQPFATVHDLFFVALQRNVPDAGEGLLTLVGGELDLVPSSSVDLRLEDDPAFVRMVAAMPFDTPVRARTAETSVGTLRWVAVPVSVAGGAEEGRYVIAYSLDVERAAVADAYRTYSVVAVVALVLVAVVGWAVAGRLLRPVRLVRDTAQRISDTDLSGRIPVRGSDDVSELARTVNAMLDRLEAAFAGHREALDDAGHELRTPITIIRGHLELMDAGDPAEVAETRALALDELDRMRRLVDDLVLLAQARRPDFVRPAPTDVGRLVDDVLDKARPLAARAWQVDARPDAVVELDHQRITQALLQLVANAVRFTGEGDVVAIGASATGGVVRLWVRDTGPGVPPDQAERIFDRFHRVTPGRGDDGSGLGLAIVRAIAEAHHGRAEVVSVLGQGASFVLELPARSVPEPTAEQTTEVRG